jgi:hypothetical protein
MTSDASGRFRVLLAPGVYQLKAVAAVGFRSTTTQTVTVGSAGATVTVLVDSGIR